MGLHTDPLQHPHGLLPHFLSHLFIWIAFLKLTMSKQIVQSSSNFGMSMRRSSGRRSGGRLLAMTQWPVFPSVFSFFFPLFFPSVAIFSHRRSARIKKRIQRNLTGAPKNLGVDHFPDPGGHFGTPWRPCWIFEVLIEGIIKSKNLFSES